MHTETLSAGTTVAGRYRIEDLVGETARSQTWRAVDHVLDRSVSVQALSSQDAASEAFLTAARRATAVEDSRFLRVLDAAHENGLAYVVREWASGVSLDNVLQQGPLPTRRATEVVREVAEAVAAAHRADVQHRRLDPARVIIKHNGAVRVLGLATDHALHAPDETVEGAAAAGELSDVTALGRLLYACLVARWPGGRDLGLPSAPTEHGRLLRPRQVRAGVDPAVDAVCDAILRTGPHVDGTGGLGTAQQVARELAVVGRGEEAVTAFAPVGEQDETLPRGVLPVPPDPRGPPPAVHTVAPPRTAQAGPPRGGRPAVPDRGRTRGRGPVWLAVALLAALLAVIGVLALGPVGGDDGSVGADLGGGSGQESAQRLDVRASDLDPLGDGTENPETASLATDGDVGTAWTTSSYYTELSDQKAGVGLLLDLGRPHQVDSVELRLTADPTSLELYAAPAGDPAPGGVESLDVVADARDATGTVTLRPPEGTSTQYLVVWLTDLPAVDDGVWRGTLPEITVRG